MNDIKARMKSVKSTMQITKAMELVATSKLRKAKESVERSRPFHEILRAAIDEIERSNEIKDS
ncbi:MAG: F0F1 ATP synthase subunit gamma, partial [Clostridia bacterium]|nr:F0F1 ATP synthase subunit gamma [Clostridia bacterium]